MENASFSGAVLAGGRSSRMGRDKASLRIAGRPLLDMQLDKLRSAGITELMVSASQRTRMEAPRGSQIIEDLLPDCGPLAAIASVLSASDAEWCVILSVDAAGVSPKTIEKLMRTARNSSADIAVLASDSGLQPLIGVYRKSLAADALALAGSGRRAVRSLFEDHPPVLMKLPDDSPELINCNTPEDLEQYAALAEPSGG